MRSWLTGCYGLAVDEVLVELDVAASVSRRIRQRHEHVAAEPDLSEARHHGLLLDVLPERRACGGSVHQSRRDADLEDREVLALGRLFLRGLTHLQLL